jgi:hypothetical protein
MARKIGNATLDTRAARDKPVCLTTAGEFGPNWSRTGGSAVDG